jgi:poly-gamma-glutamate synthesis protein (capsule biosynthesis protein)
MAQPRPAHAARPRKALGFALALVVAAVVGVGGAVAVAGGGSPDATASGPQNSPPASGTPSAAPTSEAPSPSPTPTVEPDLVFSLIAGGDVLPHTAVVRSATTADGYDFTKLMAPSEDFIRGADIALCHMEVPVAPKGTKPSGYPMFAAPKQLVPDLAAVGWDGCSTASNHSVDKGFAGIEATLDAFQAAGMGHAGTARSKDESTQVQFYDVTENGRTVKMAQISWTYGLNGLSKPKGKPWSVNVFDMADADVTPILNAAEDARAEGADIVVASVHCCVEYTTQPGSVQKQIVQQIADSGLVDLYIGHHAHVPQPIALLDGGPRGKGMWAAYGLGNFVSNQDASTVGVKQSANGVLLTATFTVTPEDDVGVQVGWTAITVDRTGGHKVYPITADTGAVGKLSAATVKARWELVAKAVGDAAPEITAPGTPFAESVEVSERTP